MECSSHSESNGNCCNNGSSELGRCAKVWINTTCGVSHALVFDGFTIHVESTAQVSGTFNLWIRSHIASVTLSSKCASSAPVLSVKTETTSVGRVSVRDSECWCCCTKVANICVVSVACRSHTVKITHWITHCFPSNIGAILASLSAIFSFSAWLCVFSEVFSWRCSKCILKFTLMTSRVMRTCSQCWNLSNFEHSFFTTEKLDLSTVENSVSCIAFSIKKTEFYSPASFHGLVLVVVAPHMLSTDSIISTIIVGGAGGSWFSTVIWSVISDPDRWISLISICWFNSFGSKKSSNGIWKLHIFYLIK